MEETGTVVEVKDRLAVVAMEAKGACHSCSARGVCHLGGDKTMVTEALNDLGAQVGDVVCIRLDSRSVIGAAFLLYIVPLLFFFGGLALGHTLTHSQAWAVIGGFLFMAGSYLSLKFLDRWLNRSGKLRPEVIEIVSRTSSKTPQDVAAHDQKDSH